MRATPPITRCSPAPQAIHSATPACICRTIRTDSPMWAVASRSPSSIPISAAPERGWRRRCTHRRHARQGRRLRHDVRARRPAREDRDEQDRRTARDRLVIRSAYGQRYTHDRTICHERRGDLRVANARRSRRLGVGDRRRKQGVQCPRARLYRSTQIKFHPRWSIGDAIEKVTCHIDRDNQTMFCRLLDSGKAIL